ncbi:MAG: hypothetical protein GY758_02220 [Fuerstiella sp.]|nr:hypothetical protein [Fuerstiella sp.]
MKRRSNSRQHTATGRRGSITVWTVFVMFSCICCVTLVASTSYLSVLRSDSHHCAQAAARAAGRQLLTDDILRRDHRDFEVAAWNLKAKNAAISVGQAYVSGHAIPELTPRNITVKMGSIVDVHLGPAVPSEFSPARILVNVANYERNRSSNVFLSGLIGITRGRISEYSEVILKNHILGFRPRSDSAIPIVPLALPEDPTFRISDCWSAEIETGRGKDRFRWDESRDVVGSGPDRLPELVLTISSEDIHGGPGIGQLISWNPQLSVMDAVDQFTTGLHPEHLSADTQGVLSFPCSAGRVSASSRYLREISKAIRPLVGQVRMFPLYDVSAGQSSEQSDSGEESQNGTVAVDRQLLQTVAARIIRLEVVSEQQLRVVLQPAVLSTPTAVIAAANDNTPHNRYVWKICLVR